MGQTSCLSAQWVYQHKILVILILSKLITLPISQPHSFLIPSSPLAFTCSLSGQPTLDLIIMQNSSNLELTKKITLWDGSHLSTSTTLIKLAFHFYFEPLYLPYSFGSPVLFQPYHLSQSWDTVVYHFKDSIPLCSRTIHLHHPQLPTVSCSLLSHSDTF